MRRCTAPGRARGIAQTDAHTSVVARSSARILALETGSKNSAAESAPRPRPRCRRCSALAPSACQPPGLAQRAGERLPGRQLRAERAQRRGRSTPATLCLINRAAQPRAACTLLRPNSSLARIASRPGQRTWSAGDYFADYSLSGPVAAVAHDRLRLRSRTPRARGCSTGQNIGWGTGAVRHARGHRARPGCTRRRTARIMLTARLSRRRRRRGARRSAEDRSGSARRHVRASSPAARGASVARLAGRGRSGAERGPPSAPASEAGPPAAEMPSTRIAFRPRLSFSRPSLELTSCPDSSRTRSRR